MPADLATGDADFKEKSAINSTSYPQTPEQD